MFYTLSVSTILFIQPVKRDAPIVALCCHLVVSSRVVTAEETSKIISGSIPLTTANLKNRAAFSRWMYNFHKCVNGLLGKKTKLSYTAVRDRYENFRSRCTRPTRRRRSGRKKERGCTRPIYGVRKSRCILQIVPRGGGQRTLHVDKACVKSS